MSEASDDAQLPVQDEVVPPAAVDAPSDADDVEVLAQAPADEPAAPRHDSVSPTSRKLAPPPKPKRDSSQPGSMPPSGGDGALNVGSLKAPSAPSISFQDASLSSRDAVAAAPMPDGMTMNCPSNWIISVSNERAPISSPGPDFT